MPRVEQLHETLVLIALSTTMLTLWVEVRCHARNQFRGTTNALQILAPSTSQSESVKPAFQFRQQSLVTVPEGF